MARPKPITKEQCLIAMKQTRSVLAAARYLNCSYQHLKPYMKAYKDEETGLSLFELHKNQSGKGIPKFMSNSPFGKKMPSIEDVMNGKIDSNSFSPDKLKFKMVEAGYLVEECYWCGFNEKRDIDGKIPLIMFFKDSNKNNYKDGNCQLSCYNCYFIKLGNVFTEKDLESLEGHKTTYKTSDAVNLQLDDFQKEQLKKIGKFDPKVDDDPYSLVSRKK
jgi:hypothetical protein